jgi:hypothetical protein
VLVRQRGGTGTEEFSVDPAWKALFTAWADEPFDEELEDAIYNFGLEIGGLESVFLRWGVVRDKRGDIMPDSFSRELWPDGMGFTLGPQLRDSGIHFPVDLSFDFALFPQATGLAHVKRWSASARWHFGAL